MQDQRNIYLIGSKSTAKHKFTLVGVVDILSNDRTEYRWDDEALIIFLAHLTFYASIKTIPPVNNGT